MTPEDWYTFAFMSGIFWAIGATMAGFIKWDELTRRKNQAEMAIKRKELTPSMARQILKTYAIASLITIFWFITIVGGMLMCVGWVIWQGLKILWLALQRDS